MSSEHCPSCGVYDPMGEAVWHKNDCKVIKEETMELDCKICGEPMIGVDDPDYENADSCDRACQERPTRCEECCNCGSHS